MKDKLTIAMSRIESMLREHKLDDWIAEFNGQRKTIALTYHAEKKIVFSKYFVSMASKEEFEGVALHEIAHALLGPGYGHGPEFFEMCTTISPTDAYAVPQGNFQISRYLFSCPECGYSGTHNSSADKLCGYCFRQGKEVKFNKEINKIEVRSW